MSPLRIAVAVGATIVAAILVWQAIAAGGVPDPTAPNTPLASATLDIGVLVVRSSRIGQIQNFLYPS